MSSYSLQEHSGMAKLQGVWSTPPVPQQHILTKILKKTCVLPLVLQVHSMGGALHPSRSLLV